MKSGTIAANAIPLASGLILLVIAENVGSRQVGPKP
tara:strand:- start:19648 stop:19755 length:108 start_codon:yes stop_codon:yes gene_type:complete